MSPRELEAHDRRVIIVGVLALPPQRVDEFHAEPCKVGNDRGLEGWFAALAVEILHPEKQARFGLFGEALVKECGISVAEVERAVRRRREAKHGGSGFGRHERQVDAKSGGRPTAGEKPARQPHLS